MPGEFAWQLSKYSHNGFSVMDSATLAQFLDSSGSWCENTFNALRLVDVTLMCVILYAIFSNHSAVALTKPVFKTPTILDRSQLGFLQTLWYSIIMAVGSLAADMTLTPQLEATVHHQQSCLTLDTQRCLVCTAQHWVCMLLVFCLEQTIQCTFKSQQTVKCVFTIQPI